MDTNKKQKRYYKLNETVWVIGEKCEGVIVRLDPKNLEADVSVNKEDDPVTLKFWEIDTLKYSARKKKEKENTITNKSKRTFFASVGEGVIPTKDEENAGRDCYARLKPIVRDGKEIYELHIQQFTLAKIPLGFASYLDKNDLLSLKHERSSIGSTGLINVSGLIDSTYQGEVILQAIPVTSNITITSEIQEKYYSKQTNTHYIPYNKAICQAVVLTQSEAKDEHIEYDELLKKPSTRGTQGWGLGTGK